MSAWNRESPEALVKVQQIRLAELEAENKRLKAALTDTKDNAYDPDYIFRIVDAALEGGDGWPISVD